MSLSSAMYWFNPGRPVPIDITGKLLTEIVDGVPVKRLIH